VFATVRTQRTQVQWQLCAGKQMASANCVWVLQMVFV
jgi:hypothetical protein